MTTDVPAQRTWFTFFVLTSGVTAYAVLQSLVVPVLPTIQRSLHTTQASVTWVLTAYLLSASIFTPILGRVGDINGKKRTFVAALVALCIGSVISALAGNIGVMIVGRVIQGVGGGVLPLAFGIIRDEFPADRVAGAVGNLASILAVGTGVGIVLAGPIENSLDVHWLFWLPAILIAVSALATYVVVPESPARAPGRISVVPALFLSGWLVCALLALSQAPTWGWGSAKVLGLFAAAAVLAVFWVMSERRAASPLIDMRMMRLPAVWTTNLVALLVGVGMYATFAFLPEFVQTPRSAGYGFGASITQSGLILLPSAATMFVVGLFAGRMVHAVGAKRVIVSGAVIATASMVLLTTAHDEKWELFLTTGIMGLGFGMAYSSMSSLIVDAVPPAQTGVASGMNANIRTIGGSIGAALLASIVTAGTPAGRLPHESGYTAGFALLAVASALSAVAALLIPSLQRRPDAEDEPAHPALAMVAGGTVVGDKPE
jgi:EmrB/QacA subfamily drug resistance transporter